MLGIVLAISKVWHSTDSVLYLERLIEEKDIRIEELKERLKPSPVEEFQKAQLEMLKGKEMPKPIQGRENWNILAARISREQREKIRDAESITKDSD